ncbi:Uncharacterised protein r2_g832 [Pycnogonum litorale]
MNVFSTKLWCRLVFVLWILDSVPIAVEVSAALREKYHEGDDHYHGDTYHPFIWAVKIRIYNDDDKHHGRSGHNRRLKQEDFHHKLERLETHQYFEQEWLKEFFNKHFRH